MRFFTDFVQRCRGEPYVNTRVAKKRLILGHEGPFDFRKNALEVGNG